MKTSLRGTREGCASQGPFKPLIVLPGRGEVCVREKVSVLENELVRLCVDKSESDSERERV